MDENVTAESVRQLLLFFYSTHDPHDRKYSQQMLRISAICEALFRRDYDVAVVPNTASWNDPTTQDPLMGSSGGPSGPGVSAPGAGPGPGGPPPPVSWNNHQALCSTYPPQLFIPYSSGLQGTEPNSPRGLASGTLSPPGEPADLEHHASRPSGWSPLSPPAMSPTLPLSIRTPSAVGAFDHLSEPLQSLAAPSPIRERAGRSDDRPGAGGPARDPGPARSGPAGAGAGPGNPCGPAELGPGQTTDLLPDEQVALLRQQFLVTFPGHPAVPLISPRDYHVAFRQSRLARARTRFVVPVLQWRGQNICRSSTLSLESEVYLHRASDQAKGLIFRSYSPTTQFPGPSPPPSAPGSGQTSPPPGGVRATASPPRSPSPGWPAEAAAHAPRSPLAGPPSHHVRGGSLADVLAGPSGPALAALPNRLSHSGSGRSASWVTSSQLPDRPYQARAHFSSHAPSPEGPVTAVAAAPEPPCMLLASPSPLAFPLDGGSGDDALAAATAAAAAAAMAGSPPGKPPAVSTISLLRATDISLLSNLGVRFIFDLMVEFRKVNEKADSAGRYSRAGFEIVGIPYPGCEFFKDFRDRGYCARQLYYDWDLWFVNAPLSIPAPLSAIVPAGHPTPSAFWSQYQSWDLIHLTRNYLELIFGALTSGEPGPTQHHRATPPGSSVGMKDGSVDSRSNGILVHCISGWDRTPLFISLIRILLWAAGEAHASLSAVEFLYFTVAYDWLLFGHQLPTRIQKGEDIFAFCFYVLAFLTDIAIAHQAGQAESDAPGPEATESKAIPTPSAGPGAPDASAPAGSLKCTLLATEPASGGGPPLPAGTSFHRQAPTSSEADLAWPGPGSLRSSRSRTLSSSSSSSVSLPETPSLGGGGEGGDTGSTSSQEFSSSVGSLGAAAAAVAGPFGPAALSPPPPHRRPYLELPLESPATGHRAKKAGRPFPPLASGDGQAGSLSDDAGDGTALREGELLSLMPGPLPDEVSSFDPGRAGGGGGGLAGGRLLFDSDPAGAGSAAVGPVLPASPTVVVTRRGFAAPQAAVVAAPAGARLGPAPATTQRSHFAQTHAAAEPPPPMGPAAAAAVAVMFPTSAPRPAPDAPTLRLLELRMLFRDIYFEISGNQFS
ncbi:hypothetical protein H696_02860 [Fonticula alba]|uniref:Myotubularin phosphatase domain-containing protein n=1 Tax=Fonticula alba TaxID=691883 RepID=A0A058Z8V8_FONAL|nr:hypothetical protein H696_02860 [Fonticula alba]KCV70511.1 hypothetical protein H696_02860 [Fonticula alba]|eukprot:XP_009495027.1 hypothetical protein H696_02860 [Fonticula alba]